MASPNSMLGEGIAALARLLAGENSYFEESPPKTLNGSWINRSPGEHTGRRELVFLTQRREMRVMFLEGGVTLRERETDMLLRRRGVPEFI